MWFPLQECEEPEPSHEHVSPGAAHALEKAVPQSRVPQGPILGHSAEPLTGSHVVPSVLLSAGMQPTQLRAWEKVNPTPLPGEQRLG